MAINDLGKIVGCYGGPNNTAWVREPNGKVTEISYPNAVVTCLVTVNLLGESAGFYATAQGGGDYLLEPNGEKKLFSAPRGRNGVSDASITQPRGANRGDVCGGIFRNRKRAHADSGSKRRHNRVRCAVHFGGQQHDHRYTRHQQLGRHCGKGHRRKSEQQGQGLRAVEGRDIPCHRCRYISRFQDGRDGFERSQDGCGVGHDWHDEPRLHSADWREDHDFRSPECRQHICAGNESTGYDRRILLPGGRSFP